jgi:hypothetical protein
MDSYIVRVYRRSKSKSGEEVAGLVEGVGTDQRLSFQTFSGLVSTIKQVVGRGEVENKVIYKLHTKKEVATNK